MQFAAGSEDGLGHQDVGACGQRTVGDDAAATSDQGVDLARHPTLVDAAQSTDVTWHARR